MPVNIYDTPADATFINTYERMPIDQIMQAGIAMQDRWDRGEAAQDALDEALDIDVNQWRTPEKREAVGKFKDRINTLIDDAEGEYHRALPGLEKLYKELQGELKEGVLGGLQTDYKAREALKAKLEKMKDDKNHPMSEKKAARLLAAADRTAKKSGKLQKDVYGTWTEGQYKGITPATQISVFEKSRQLLKDLPLMDNEQLGAWLEGKGIPYVINSTTGKVEASKVGLPEGSYEAIDAIIKGRGTPEQQIAFLQTVFSSEPEFKNIIAEETMLAMSELDAAEELQPGIKESRLHDASTSDLATIQRLEKAGVDIYSEEGQEAILNATLEKEIRNKLISDPITQAVQAYGRQTVTYDRNKMTPSTSSSNAKKGYDAYTKNLILDKTIDLVNNTMSGIKFQEKNLTEQKKNITSLEGRLADAEEIKANNPSTVYDNEIKELERQLTNAEVELTTSEAELRNAYSVAQVFDPSTGEMITDSYIEKRVKEKGDAAELRAQEVSEIMRQAGDSSRDAARIPGREVAQLGERRRLEAIRDDALEVAQEQNLFSTTKFPYVFTANSAGPYSATTGYTNEVNTANFMSDDGGGWSLVLNGGELTGTAFRDYFKEFKENEGSDKWSGYSETGVVFVRATNQTDNGGFPVYTVGIQGKDSDGNVKVVTSHLITKGEAGGTAQAGEYYNLAKALSQSDDAQFKDIGDQMLADIYIKPYLGTLDIQNLKLDQPVGIPGLTDPVTNQQIKLIRTGLGDATTSEFIAVVDTPQGKESDRDIVITHDGKEARYLPVTNIAGGEEDLYQRLYQFHKGKSNEVAQEKAQNAQTSPATSSAQPTTQITTNSQSVAVEEVLTTPDIGGNIINNIIADSLGTTPNNVLLPSGKSLASKLNENKGQREMMTKVKEGNELWIDDNGNEIEVNPKYRSQFLNQNPNAEKVEDATELTSGNLTGKEITDVYNDVLEGTNKDILHAITPFQNAAYEFGDKDSTDSIDCSGFVAAVYEEIGITLNPGDLSSDGIWRNSTEKETYTDWETIPNDSLQPGTVIAFDTGEYSYDKRRKTGIDHIGIIVFDGNGNPMIAESSGSKDGVTLTPFKERMAELKKVGLKKTFIGKYSIS